MTLSFRVNQLMELFDEDEEMVFANTPEEMRDAVLRFKRDDAARRRIAEAGWRKSHARLNERLVARYIEEIAVPPPAVARLCLADDAMVSAAAHRRRAAVARELRHCEIGRGRAVRARFRQLQPLSRSHRRSSAQGACEYSDVRYLRTRGLAAMVAARTQRLCARGSRASRWWKLRAARNPEPALRWSSNSATRCRGSKLALHLHNDPQTMDGSRIAADRARLLRQVDAIYCVSDSSRSDFSRG